jgi:benzoyl-CoA reductase subunit C
MESVIMVRKGNGNTMEDKLQNLLNAGSQENRAKWAHQWQAQGKKVIGVLDSLVPEEVIYAAGMLPWRVHGTWQDDVSLAMVYRIPQSSAFCNHVLQSVLEGRLDFLDGVVCSNRDQDFVRLWDAWERLGKTQFVHLIDVPIKDTEASRKRFAAEIRELISQVEKLGKAKINHDSLHKAIAAYDRGRALSKKVYEMRKKEVPPLSGGEALALTAASMVMPRSEFNRALEKLIPYLEKRQADVRHTHPRLLLSSDKLDNRAYVDLVEEVGCLVATDDMDTGSRYFWEMVGDAGKDPVYALAKRYLKNRSSRMLDWQEQVDQIIQWVRDFQIDGVLDLPETYDHTRQFRSPFLERRMKEASIPEMSFEREYQMADTGQLKTRIGAFLEMLKGQASA